MEDKLYFFQTPEGKFVFDGNAVAIFEYEKEEDIVRLPSVSVSSIDCHRVRFLKTICLILNNSCNLSCKYCYAHQGVYDKPLAQLDYKKAIKAVELIAKSVVANKAKDMTIAFFRRRAFVEF